MRRWWKLLGLLAAVWVSLGEPRAAWAQFPGDGPPPPPDPNPPFTMKDDGAPNAFSDMYGVRTPSVSAPREGPLSRLLPGIFHPRYTAGVAAEFPNPAQPSCEDASPFKMQEGGMPNGFTELCAPQPGHWFFGLGQRLLHTELVEGPSSLEPYCFTFRGEYLRWHVPGGPSAVPLVSTSTNFPVEIGALGQPSTQILVPASSELFHYGNLPGFRLTMGIATGYFPPIEISGFLLQRGSVTAFSGGSLSNPNQLLVVPVQDVAQPIIAGIGADTAILVEVPPNLVVGAFGGVININSQLHLWGIEANGFLNCICSDNVQIDGILGYRHINLDELIQISTQTGGANAAGVFFGGNTAPAGFLASTLDQFGTRNIFDGGQFGLRGVLSCGRWSLFSDAKVALGNTRETLSITGISTLSGATGGASLPGGIFALPSNSGTFSQNRFTIAPEVNVALSVQLHRCLRAFVGYDFLYLNNVIRPGDAISNIVDSRQMPTFGANYNPAASTGTPGVPGFVHRDFFAQGFFVGLEIGF
jgi:hypothetical protein